MYLNKKIYVYMYDDHHRNWTDVNYKNPKEAEWTSKFLKFSSSSRSCDELISHRRNFKKVS